MTTATTTRRKRCSRCNELKHDVLGRQRLCEDCEADMSYCTVCDEWEDRCWGDGCRHVGWSAEQGCNAGCGTQDIDADTHRESFAALLKLLAPLETSNLKWTGEEFLEVRKPLLPQVRDLIAANKFWTQWHGPLIGGPPDLAFRYVVRRRGQQPLYPELYDLRAETQLAWGEETIEAVQLGMAWLTSLDSKSVAANQLTAKWIDDWIALGRTTV